MNAPLGAAVSAVSGEATWTGPVQVASVDRESVTGADFDEVMELVVHGFEIGGVTILVVGALGSFIGAAATFRRAGAPEAYGELRRNVGRAILLGLEFLIIADIVLTITVEPTLESALALGLIVLVRTFLSFSLEVELEGTLPWRRATKGRAADVGGTVAARSEKR